MIIATQSSWWAFVSMLVSHAWQKSMRNVCLTYFKHVSNALVLNARDLSISFKELITRDRVYYIYMFIV